MAWKREYGSGPNLAQYGKSSKDVHAGVFKYDLNAPQDSGICQQAFKYEHSVMSEDLGFGISIIMGDHGPY